MVRGMKNPYIEKAISAAGSQSALARHVGHAQSLIHDWLHNKKRVSVDSVPLIVRLTGGDVRHQDLRPNDWQRIWPELNTQPPHNQ